MEAKEIVYNAMKKAGKELKTGEIAELVGLDKKDAEKAVKILNTETRIFFAQALFLEG